MLYFDVLCEIMRVAMLVLSNTGQRWRWAYIAGVTGSVGRLLTVGFEQSVYATRADVVQYAIIVTVYFGSLLLYICSF